MATYVVIVTPSRSMVSIVRGCVRVDSFFSRINFAALDSPRSSTKILTCRSFAVRLFRCGSESKIELSTNTVDEIQRLVNYNVFLKKHEKTPVSRLPPEFIQVLDKAIEIKNKKRKEEKKNKAKVIREKKNSYLILFYGTFAKHLNIPEEEKLKLTNDDVIEISKEINESINQTIKEIVQKYKRNLKKIIKPLRTT